MNELEFDLFGVDGLGKVDREKMKKSIVDTVSENIFKWKKPWKPVKEESQFLKIRGKVVSGIINAYNLRPYENIKNVFSLFAFTQEFNAIYGTDYAPVFVPMAMVIRNGWEVQPRNYNLGELLTCTVNQSFWAKIDENDPVGKQRIERYKEKLKNGEGLPYGVRRTEDGNFLEIAFTAQEVVLAENIIGNPMKVERVKIEEGEMIDYVENIIKAFSVNVPTVYHNQQDRCFYYPVSDTIHLVPAKGFENINEYYSTRFHETVHSTLHKKRLNRDFGSKKWGDAGYAEEELVAEIGSYMLCAELGVNYYRKDKTTPFSTKENSMAYLASWVKKAKELYNDDEEKAIVEAFNHASRAVDYILKGVDFESMIPDSVKKLEDEETADVTIYENDDVKVVDVRTDDRVRMFFKKVPSETIRKELLAEKFKYAKSFKAWQVVNNAEGKETVYAFLAKYYGFVPSEPEAPKADDSKLRLAKARAKAIIIRQRQRSRSNGVKGINYEMD